MTLAQLEPCVRMNLVTIITHVFAEVDTLESIVILRLILAQQTEIHVRMVLLAQV